MPVKIEPNSLSDAVKWEQDADYSRAKVTIGSQGSVKLLEVVGQITATGKYQPLDTVATNGLETAVGISLLDVDASGGDRVGVILNDDSMVDMNALVWPVAITVPQKDVAIAQLASLGIKAVSAA